jgi:hypothetical protein
MAYYTCLDYMPTYTDDTNKYKWHTTRARRDQRLIAYSSWSDKIQLIGADGDYADHESLHMCPGFHSCMFSVRFSHDCASLITGLNHGYVIRYDVERKHKLEQFRAHADDVNSVCYLQDESADVFLTGSDDGLGWYYSHVCMFVCVVATRE